LQRSILHFFPHSALRTPPSSSPTPHSALRTPHSKSGQAIIEFCIGIVALLAVIGGIFQLGRLGLARTQARVDATRVAHNRSMFDISTTGLSLPRYIDRMSDGRDDYSYSEDDIAIGGNDQEAFDRLASHMQPSLAHRHAAGNPVGDITDPTQMILGMGLVHGNGMELNIPVLPVVRRLFFNRDSIDLQVTAWMTRTGDLY
jgi:hypothetical protein